MLPVRLAELMASFSLAIDLGTGPLLKLHTLSRSTGHGSELALKDGGCAVRLTALVIR